MNLQLRYGPFDIGEIEGAFWADETGYGVLRPTVGDVDNPTLRRVRDYIAFSEEWHERLKAERPHTSDEWDAYREVHGSGLWHVVSPGGLASRIEGPVFVAGEVSLRSA